MGKIFIIGLGPGNVDALTLGAIDRINSGDKNFLRTRKHPTVEYFHEKNISYKSYDYIYDTEQSFNKVYELIVEDLINESKNYERINYFVPGNPLVAEKTVQILLSKNLDVEIVSGMSFIEPIMELVGRDPIDGLKIVDGASFDSLVVDINVDIIITQVYNSRIISEVKLILSEIYGDEHNIYLIHSAGIKEEEKMYNIPLYQLDRMDGIGYLTSIYVPKLIKANKEKYNFNDLVEIMRTLRSEDGCPWDIEQTHESIRQCVIEEAYEVVDAIDKEDMDGLAEELGDLLLQVIFHCQIGSEEGTFDLYQVISTLCNKLIYRHPHIFSEKKVEKSEEVVYNWNKLKYAKRNITSFVDKIKDIPKLPSLMSSFKVQERAAEIGFDWENVDGALEKVIEEYKEVIEAIKIPGGDKESIEEELGDLFFATVNVCRFLDINPEVALNKTINKFIHRLEIMDEKANQAGKSLESMTLEEMNVLWNIAKIHKN